MNSLINRLHRHLSQLSPHQRERESGRLLDECLNALVDAKEALTYVKTVPSTLVTNPEQPVPTPCGPNVRSSPWKDVYTGRDRFSGTPSDDDDVVTDE